MDTIPSLSIVVATYNRAAYLPGLLDSLAAQTLDVARWEVVLVDNNSTDDTRAVIEAFAAAHPAVQLQLIGESNQGLSFARNAGIQHSRGAFIAIVDDDERVNPGFAAAYIDFFESHPAVSGAGGAVVAEYESAPPRWLTRLTARPITGELDLGPRARPFPRGKYPPGGNMAVRREALARHGLFNTTLGRTGDKLLGGEEKELFERLSASGERAWYLPDAVICHRIPAAKLTPAYFDRVNRMVGESERLRTRAAGVRVFRLRLVVEGVKWVAAGVLFFIYLFTLRPAKGWFLLRQRWQISRGLVGD